MFGGASARATPSILPPAKNTPASKEISTAILRGLCNGISAHAEVGLAWQCAHRGQRAIAACGPANGERDYACLQMGLSGLEALFPSGSPRPRDPTLRIGPRGRFCKYLRGGQLPGRSTSRGSCASDEQVAARGWLAGVPAGDSGYAKSRFAVGTGLKLLRPLLRASAKSGARQSSSADHSTGTQTRTLLVLRIHLRT